MSINLKKSVWILALSFCCIFLSESVALGRAASDKTVEEMSEEAEEDSLYAERKEHEGRYLKVYINENLCVKIDVLFIFGGLRCVLSLC